VKTTPIEGPAKKTHRGSSEDDRKRGSSKEDSRGSSDEDSSRESGKEDRPIVLSGKTLHDITPLII